MDLAPKLWSLTEWDRMLESGVIGEDDRLLLLEGEIFQTLPQKSAHATSLGLAQDALGATLAPGTHLRVQLPLYLGSSSDPEPDLAVVEGTRRDFATEHPRAALLVVEVSDSSLGFDTGRRAQVYSRYRIPEYWVVDLNARVVLRFTQPTDLTYASKESLGQDAVLNWAGASIPVAALLP